MSKVYRLKPAWFVDRYDVFTAEGETPLYKASRPGNRRMRLYDAQEREIFRYERSGWWSREYRFFIGEKCVGEVTPVNPWTRPLRLHDGESEITVNWRYFGMGSEFVRDQTTIAKVTQKPFSRQHRIEVLDYPNHLHIIMASIVLEEIARFNTN